MSIEQTRLEEAGNKSTPWKKWGPYLSERQWGTVREDYSENGDAWNYFTHEQARSRTYRWGEDGIGGISDDKQRLCFALALWNGTDPILKERLFGLSNSEGNHGEDVKEYYYYLDSTPTHSYMKYLYKYPQSAFPYDDLVKTNRQRSREEMEYELIDTGIFDEDRYFDVFVEYAKFSPEDILIRFTAYNRGPETAELDLLPTIWFRNTWYSDSQALRPTLKQVSGSAGTWVILASHPELGEYALYCDAAPEMLFTENETNYQRIFNTPNLSSYVKDGINNYIVNGNKETVNPAQTGTKAAAHYHLSIPSGEARTVKLRLALHKKGSKQQDWAGVFGDFDAIIDTRKREADEFYQGITPEVISEDERNVMRQALAGMLWGKQYYFFDLDTWLDQHDAHPFYGSSRPNFRNREWYHMVNDDIISMPDKWEYPWYAAWDLAFHTIALNMVDPDFAKHQLNLMLENLYQHPSGQLPAYEWNFSDVNPPVHAWATLFIYLAERRQKGQGDIEFLKNAFQKLIINFTWWVNRKDPTGKNVFSGGFLGLDNIGVFDRSSPLPTGGRLEQADGTAWMALFSQNMFEIALELTLVDPTYEDLALKFLGHFFWIAGAMDRIGENQDELWDEEDGFFYDVLVMPDGKASRIKVRSMVGLLPVGASTVIPPTYEKNIPRLLERARYFINKHPELIENIALPNVLGKNSRRLLAVLNEEKLRRVLSRMLDEDRFLSPYGIRSLSRWHKDHPYVVKVHGEEYKVEYLPAESNTGMFGGNSNWRGPVWFPVNMLIIRGLINFYLYYGDDFKIECPTGSGNLMTLYEVTMEIAHRLSRIFLKDEQGRRPVFGGSEKFQTDPHWRDYILFYEYFHGDNGAGLGASHQTGWTGLVARLIQLYGYLTPEIALNSGTNPLRSLYKSDKDSN